MLLHLPHGMFLPAGIRLKIDEIVERKEAVQTCDQRGCYVRFEMADRFLNGLIRGNKFVVIFKNLQKQDFTIPLSLKGFSAAYKKMQKSQLR